LHSNSTAPRTFRALTKGKGVPPTRPRDAGRGPQDYSPMRSRSVPSPGAFLSAPPYLGKPIAGLGCWPCRGKPDGRGHSLTAVPSLRGSAPPIHLSTPRCTALVFNGIERV